MLQTGTLVKLKTRKVLAEVLEDGIYSADENKNYYWIKILKPNHEDPITIYCEDDLTPVNCTCGANATYAPKLAPGHSYYCDLTID